MGFKEMSKRKSKRNQRNQEKENPFRGLRGNLIPPNKVHTGRKTKKGGPYQREKHKREMLKEVEYHLFSVEEE
jgi:hypothetical protein